MNLVCLSLLSVMLTSVNLMSSMFFGLSMRQRPWAMMHGISPKLLKQCALSLYQPLHYLFSLSLSQSYLPLEWRTHLLFSNLVIIILLEITGQYLCYQLSLRYWKDLSIYNGMVDFITNSISTYFYVVGLHCSRLVYFNKILTCTSQTDAVYIDFRKTFDSVAHNELLLKLWKFGINGTYGYILEPT